jgi:hypothetical protein
MSPFYLISQCFQTIPLAAHSKVWVCVRPLAGIAGSNPAGDINVFSLVSVVCCQLEVCLL